VWYSVAIVFRFGGKSIDHGRLDEAVRSSEVSLSDRTHDALSDPTAMFVLFPRNGTGRNLLQTELKSVAPRLTDAALLDFADDRQRDGESLR
jgi:hypothetical protein